MLSGAPPSQIYTLSLHDALPIYLAAAQQSADRVTRHQRDFRPLSWELSGKRDRKSTRLNSSHRTNSYAVFCLKKKNKKLSECRAPCPRERCSKILSYNFRNCNRN